MIFLSHAARCRSINIFIPGNLQPFTSANNPRLFINANREQIYIVITAVHERELKKKHEKLVVVLNFAQ